MLTDAWHIHREERNLVVVTYELGVISVRSSH